MLTDVVTPSQVLSRGLAVVNFPPERQKVRRSKNLEQFLSHFGSVPLVYASLWADMQTHRLIKVDDGDTLEDFLVAVYFLKVYPKENQAEGTLRLSDTHIRKLVWKYVPIISQLLSTKIYFPSAWNPDEDEGKDSTIFVLTVDGVHCPIWEPMHKIYLKNPKLYSHKYHKAGLNYEVAISIFENRCRLLCLY